MTNSVMFKKIIYNIYDFKRIKTKLKLGISSESFSLQKNPSLHKLYITQTEK